VLLHGIGGGRGGWNSTGEALVAAGCRVVAVDFPGYGGSPAIEPFDLPGLAASVLRLLDAIGTERAVLVGHSMGGMVAQELHARAAQRVQALVLVATSPAFGRPEGDWQREFLQSRFAPLDAGLGMAGLAAQLVPTMVAPDFPRDRLAAAQALMAGVPESTYRRAIAALVGFDRRAELARIAVPTLVITGEHDRTAPPEVARRMAAKITGSICTIVPAAGHLLSLERSDALNAALLEFLRPALSLSGADHGG
jgi:3-oxoadipate enol-lactonase